MSDHIYKKIEVVGTSTTTIDDAVRNAIKKANETVNGMRWFEITEVRGDIDNGEVAHWQTTVKIGFRIND